VRAAEDARSPHAIDFQCVADVVIGRREFGLPVKGIDAGSKVAVEIARVVVFRFGEDVLAIDLEAIAKAVAELHEQGVVGTIGVVSEPLEILNRGIQIGVEDQIEVLVARVMAA